jgi:glyoxylase-like metal-dependent hydrolase (beta-lactamase superfamily II)
MIVHPLTLGVFGVNNYLIHSPGSEKAILIDACEDYHSILRKIEQLKLELVYLINTHGHGDHIAGNEAIVNATGAQLMIHPLDQPYLTDPNLNLAAWVGGGLKSPEPDRLLNEGDTVELENLRFTVLHTPGHTPGHITLLSDEGIAFVGDVIFRESIGRTDFPGGSYDQLENSIRSKIYTLPGETILYNGHGPKTTVAHEKKFNPFVKA